MYNRRLHFHQAFSDFQVAQILQVLAMWKWEEIDPRLMDLYSRFDKVIPYLL
jgi:hypothetical protein